MRSWIGSGISQDGLLLIRKLVHRRSSPILVIPLEKGIHVVAPFVAALVFKFTVKKVCPQPANKKVVEKEISPRIHSCPKLRRCGLGRGQPVRWKIC